MELLKTGVELDLRSKSTVKILGEVGASKTTVSLDILMKLADKGEKVIYMTSELYEGDAYKRIIKLYAKLEEQGYDWNKQLSAIIDNIFITNYTLTKDDLENKALFRGNIKLEEAVAVLDITWTVEEVAKHSLYNTAEYAKYLNTKVKHVILTQQVKKGYKDLFNTDSVSNGNLVNEADYILLLALDNDSKEKVHGTLLSRDSDKQDFTYNVAEIMA